MGRYALHGEIASGGMATVHFGRLVGEAGFSRTVAVKRLHPQLARDPEFGAMFLDEARLAARVQHPNVVPTLDVVALEGELFLVMEYVQGESLARLIKAGREAGVSAPPRVAAGVVSGVLLGLHAAHEAVSEQGEPLGIVHRDVSPQNILVGVDGVARVLDFGVAKARGRLQTTRDGQIKGKIAYMAPEQLRGAPVDRRVDIYGAACVLWELLTGRRLFDADNEGALLAMVAAGQVTPLAHVAPWVPPELDAIVMQGLAQHPDARFPTAWHMAVALEEAVGLASPRQVGEWVERLAGPALSRRARQVQDIESVSGPGAVPASQRTQAWPASQSGSSWPASQPRPPWQASQPPPGWATPPHSAPGVGALTPPPSERSDTRRSAVPGWDPAAHPGAVPPAPSSQVSSIAVIRTRPPPGRGRFRMAAMLGAAAALGGLCAALALTWGRGGDAPASVSPAAPASEAASAAAPPSSAPAEVPAEPTAPEQAASAAAPPASAAAPSQPAAGATPKTGAGSKAGAGSKGGAGKAPPRASCDPPYTVDARGIRRLKPECL